jgi:hypothetical protein
MRISSSGNVGIGTCNPISKLSIPVGGTQLNFGTDEFNNALIASGTGTGDQSLGINIQVGNPNSLCKLKGAGIDLYGNTQSTTDKGDVVINTSTDPAASNKIRLRTAGVERMRIGSAGNIGIGTTSANPSSPLHVLMCSNSNQDGVRIQARCEGGPGSQPGIALANTCDAKRWGISLDNSSDILQFTNATGANALEIRQSGETCFVGTICSGGAVARKQYDYHVGHQWYNIPFNMDKSTGVGIATTKCLVTIVSNEGFQELFFTIDYGARLQGVSDQFTNVSLRQYGVNRFNSGTISVTESYIITGVSGCSINTHAPMTVATFGTCGIAVKVDFSTTLGPSSFVWGEVRIRSIEHLQGNITISNNNYHN